MMTRYSPSLLIVSCTMFKYKEGIDGENKGYKATQYSKGGSVHVHMKLEPKLKDTL